MTDPVPLTLTKPRRHFSRASYALLSGFLAVILLILYIWWPLAEEYISYFNPAIPLWRQLDWLLIGIFLFMTITIMLRADLKVDAWIVLAGIFGGLAIESWGTQTLLWTYYTAERPPLWIIPAWPIASLSIERIYRFLKHLSRRIPAKIITPAYWSILGGFLVLMLAFIRPTFDKSLTWLALITCLLLILGRNDRRKTLLLFVAGSALGYFLERWGTTRECWTYYTRQTPPLFAVLAHGLAAVAFFRAMDIALAIAHKLKARFAWLANLPLPERTPSGSEPAIPPTG
jgi:hypothetical protein